jgi:L-cysteate sulfo-lyase
MAIASAPKLDLSKFPCRALLEGVTPIQHLPRLMTGGLPGLFTYRSEFQGVVSER